MIFIQHHFIAVNFIDPLQRNIMVFAARLGIVFCQLNTLAVKMVNCTDVVTAACNNRSMFLDFTLVYRN